LTPAATLVVLLTLAAAPPPPQSRLHKLASVLSLEDHRAPFGPELERYLRDADRGVRRRAALAAGRIGDAAAVPALVELMNDGEVEVRRMTAFALGLIGEKGLAVDRLTAALQDADALVRARSAEALGRIPESGRGKDITAMLLKALPKGAPLVSVRGDDASSANDPWTELRLSLFALARQKDAAAAEAALLADGRPRFDWWAATYTAMRVATPAMKPVLLAAAGSDDALSRALAARGLGALKDASALEPLARLAQDREAGVVIAALRALAALGDARGVAHAAAALGHAEALVKAEALAALAALPPDRSLRARVVPFAGHELPWIRAAALPALARIDREEFALVLSGMDADPEWSVRAALAAALGEVADDVSVGRLLGMLKDEDVRVLPAVLQALRKSRGNDAVPTLRQHLAHPDARVRATAAEALGELRPAGLSQELAAAYKQSHQDSEPDARLSILAALAAQKDAAARAALAEAARSDPRRALRARAAAALKQLGEQPPAPGPETHVRPHVDYREAMAPYEPLPDRPLYTPRAILHTRKGSIELHLDIVDTPLTSDSFINLARRGFFDGLTFHRVVAGFVAQGGDPRGDGSGGPGYTLRCEPSLQPYGRGVVGMALSGKDTGGSQFFITLTPQPQLDGEYTAFARVASGMEVVAQLRPHDVIERVEIWDGRP
jgi:cyclophilin family peptidyl-prolyl cis-trans isomerase/HEAT repeat protein